MHKLQDDSYLTINYKKIKKKGQIVNFKELKKLHIIIILLIYFTREVASEDYSLRRCDAPTQQSIFENLPQCLPRPSLVDMRQHFADHHDVIQVCLIICNTKIICRKTYINYFNF